MPLYGYLWRFRRGDPVAKVCNTTHHNRVASILEDIVGVGLRIEKNTDGTAWRIINDGTSDEIPPPGSGVGESGYPWGDQYTFGLKRTGTNKITVYKGKLRRYGDPQGVKICYEAADTEVTFAGDGAGQRIVWKWSPDTGLTILATPQTNDPMDDSSYIYGVVAIFTVTNGIPILTDYQQCGIIVLREFTVAGS
jgi:hypothetical protein